MDLFCRRIGLPACGNRRYNSDQEINHVFQHIPGDGRFPEASKSPAHKTVVKTRCISPQYSERTPLNVCNVHVFSDTLTSDSELDFRSTDGDGNPFSADLTTTDEDTSYTSSLTQDESRSLLPNGMLFN